jgi:hypothetical protein
MASLVLTGDTSGQVTIAAPAVAGTTTLTLPATTGTVLTDATVGVCRAWVNFNGTGTPAIRASFNVSSITDNGVGQYTINITTALADTNFATLVSAGDTTVSSANSTMTYVGSKSTTTQFVAIRNGTNSDVDRDQVLIAIFR